MEPGFQSFGVGRPPLGRAVRQLLFITVGLFILEVLLDPRALDARYVGPLAKLFGLSWTDVRRGMVWQLVTYMFLHGSVMHVLMNMLGLYFLGRELETMLGSRRFLQLYLGCGVLGGLGWLLLSGASGARCVGASGAVFGIVGAFAAIFPHRQLTILLFFVLPITTSARRLALFFGLASLLMLRMGGGGIAHAAHLAGGIGGYLYGLWVAGPARHGPARHGPAGRTAWTLANLRAWNRRRRYKVVSDAATPVNWTEVDTVLDKIHLSGVGSLTRTEKELLDRASKTARR